MFDVGFWELVLCAVVALIVLGPERMPVAVRPVVAGGDATTDVTMVRDAKGATTAVTLTIVFSRSSNLQPGCRRNIPPPLS